MRKIMDEPLDPKDEKKLLELEKQSTKEIKAVKRDVAQAMESQRQALQMQADGFSVEQIAEALGYSSSQISYLLGTKVEVGSPEQVLQESLRTVVSLIPVADAQYRVSPTLSYAQALTGFISAAKDIVGQMYELQDKESMFKTLIVEVLQPFVRQMIVSFSDEARGLSQEEMGETGSARREEAVNKLARTMGTKFQEGYREYVEKLSTILGVSDDMRARVLVGLNKDKPT
jgi:hypothetical protein